MNKPSFSEQIRTALFDAIKKTSKDINLCVNTPGKDFSRNRKLPLKVILLMLIGIGSGSLTKELLEHFDYSPDTATASAFVQQRKKFALKR